MFQSVARPKRRLGVYCPGAGTGGPWRYVHSLLAAIDPAEFEVTVFCDLPGQYEPQPSVKVVRLKAPPPVGHAQATEAPAAAPVRTASPQMSSHPRWLKVWPGFGREVLRLARLIKQHPVDLFHTQNTGCEESPVAARWAGVKRILGTFHVDSTYDLHRERSGPTYRLLEMLSNRCLDRAIAVSGATKRDWVRRTQIPANRVVTIHNGIDPEKFRRQTDRIAARRRLELPEDSLVVGSLGRLDEAKGFAYLMDALPALLRAFPNLFLAVAGEGPLRASLTEQAARLGIADRVRFLGFQRDVQAVLDALDVFVLPSRCETLGYALLEAMATELPCVGTTVGGIPEVIVPGETGFLVRSQDSNGLAEALARLLRSEPDRARMGKAGRERVRRSFSESEMVSRTIDLYREMMSCTPGV